MTTLCPTQHEMIVFSSHLIHGLGQNRHPDTTRVSLEFRLYEQ
jgi:ectoine hydroxylase-related dioxygenase (phytanoyl-CoA dioxygenase family)